MYMRKAALLVAVCVLGLALRSWTQTAQTNQAAMDSHDILPMNRLVGQRDGLQLNGPSTQPKSRKGSIVIKEFKHDTGPVLREVAPLLPEFSPSAEREIKNNVNPNHRWPNRIERDRVLQR